jgi:hypothetical protein
MIRRDLHTGHWKPYLERALTLKPCYDGPINGGEVTFSSFTCLFNQVFEHTSLLTSLCWCCLITCKHFVCR